MAEHRFVPGPTLSRREIVERLRALGFRLVSDDPGTHHDHRGLSWEHDSGARVDYWEHHILGDRYLVADGKLPSKFTAAIESVHRLVLLQEAEAAPVLPEAMSAIRRLCLLERDAPSPELRAWLDRAFASPDLFVRHAGATAAMFLERSHALDILTHLAGNEPHPGLRARFRSTLKANQPGKKASRVSSTRSTGRGDASKKSTGKAATPSRKPAARSTKKAAATKPAARKPAATKTTARKPAATKTTARKPAAKKPTTKPAAKKATGRAAKKPAARPAKRPARR